MFHSLNETAPTAYRPAIGVAEWASARAGGTAHRGPAWSTAAITPEHGNNGDLTFGGLYGYTYDALNRLVNVTYSNGDSNDPATVTERV